MPEMKKKRVLIVDDEKDLVDVLSMRLAAEGYEVLAAYDGQEGLDKARDEAPDIILLDIMMPKMDGFQVCRLLKFDTKYKDIPIIMLTARTQDKDRVVGKQVGADDYIIKPFDSAALLAKVKKAIGSSS